MEMLISQNYCYEKMHNIFPADHSFRQEEREMLQLILTFIYEFLILWPLKTYFIYILFIF